jgi:cell division protein ZipA
MEDNLRTALIVISAVAITALFVHGFWTIRKNKNPYKLKTKQEKIEPQNRGFDGSGFDQDGVSKPRVVDSQEESALSSETAAEYYQQTENNDVPVEVTSTSEPNIGDLSALDATEQEVTAEQMDNVNEFNDKVTEFKEQEVEQKIAQEKEDDKIASELNEKAEQAENTKSASVYQEPVTQAKAVNKKSKPVNKPSNAGTKNNAKRNQIEINFGDSLEFEEPESAPRKKERKSSSRKIDTPQVDPEVLVISLVMSESQTISGATLLPMLLTLGMKYGDMNIFHRHEDNAGNGKVTFSLANMMNPGTFDLDNMETFSTQGISLFMTLPNAGDAFAVFEQMLSSAKHLALEFQGQLLDDKRSVMTKQTEQHYISKIREFERKSRIASA